MNRPKEEGLGDKGPKYLYGSADNTVHWLEPPDQKQGRRVALSRMSPSSVKFKVCVWAVGGGGGGRDSASLHCLDHGLKKIAE